MLHILKQTDSLLSVNICDFFQFTYLGFTPSRLVGHHALSERTDMLTTFFHSIVLKPDFVKDVLFVLTGQKQNLLKQFDVPLLITMNHRWMFEIHHSLTPVLEVEEFKMIGMFDICDCNITISYFLRKYLRGMTLCGKYSNTTIFGKTNAMSVHMYFRLQHMFAFTASIDMMSTDVAMTEEFSQTTFRNISCFVHRIHLEIISESLYYIFVQAKKNYIVGLLSYTKAVWSRLYDGPGFLSTHHDNPADYLSHRVLCSTFQCILEMRTKLKNPIRRLSGAYVFKILSMKNWANRIIVEGRVHTEQISILNCASSCFHIFRIKTLISSHITIAVNNLSFHGPEDFACRYGGIGLYDFDQNTSTSNEIESFCSKKDNYFHKRRNVYSSGPDMVVVAFAYEHYSSLQVTLNVTSTACHVIKFNLCPVAQQYLEKIMGSVFGNNCQHDNCILQSAMSFIHNLFNTDVQTFPRSQIHLSKHSCFIVNMFTKSFGKCEAISFDGTILPIINTLFGAYVTFDILQEHVMLYDYAVEGILVSKAEMLLSEKSGGGIDTELIISGPLHDHQVCDRTSASKWKDNNRTELKGQGLKTMCSGAKRKMKVSDEPSDFNAIMSLVSPYNGHLYFSIQHVSRAVSQKYTLSFRIMLFGYHSWLDFHFKPCQKYLQNNSVLLVHNEFTNLPVVHPEDVLLFSHNVKYGWVGKTDLNIRINSKVSQNRKATSRMFAQMSLSCCQIVNFRVLSFMRAV